MLQDVVKAEALDPAHGALQLRGRARARPAADRRRRFRSSPRPTMRAGRSTRPRSSRRSARDPTSSTQLAQGTQHRLTAAIPTIGRRTCRSIAGAGTSTRSATNISATAPRRWKRSRPAPTIFREEFTSKVWATEYDFPAIRAGKIKKEVLPDETPVRNARLLPQHEARQSQRPARAAGARSCLRFRVDQPQRLLRALQPHHELLREFADEGFGRAAGGRARVAEQPRRARLRGGASARPMFRRSATAQVRTASF